MNFLSIWPGCGAASNKLAAMRPTVILRSRRGYPDSLYASWLSPPSNDAILAQILLSQLPPTSATEDGLLRLTLKEANEENGGAILALPLAWLDRLGWVIGDTLLVHEELPGQIT
ncbi:hypothetical protein QZM81_16265 [Burkholderia cepacia]|uniref:hypothetical protein n=1 Tax=Burkholderia cepacia TaxID=292 RepID=UPI0011BE1509|nr:hypothetical protein [Burkholderia cepacia]MDN7857357.1 hypothetical protein [Burkholderia cepacia]QFS40765.1 hypothetical protein BURCE16_28600 [Burkholderia cepacia]